MRRIKYIIYLIAFGLLSQFCAADNLQFELQLSFTVPGLSDRVWMVRFNDIDRDGFPEVLAADSSQMVLYSIKDDSILFSWVSDSGYLPVEILFDDVTRDSVPDLVIASHIPAMMFPSDQGFRIEVFDEANSFSRKEKTIGMEDETDSGVDRFGTMKAVDMDRDGYNELFISCETVSSYFTESWWFRWNTTGTAFLYSIFPDSLLWRSKVFAGNIDLCKTTRDSTAFWITACDVSISHLGFGVGFNHDGSTISALYKDGKAKTTVLLPI